MRIIWKHLAQFCLTKFKDNDFQEEQIVMKYRARNGFSLVELLIVLAVVAVFCKSEFPVFARIPNNFPPGKFVNELSLANS